MCGSLPGDRGWGGNSSRPDNAFPSSTLPSPPDPEWCLPCPLLALLSFSRRDRFDHITCYLAGPTKCGKAVAISRALGNAYPAGDPRRAAYTGEAAEPLYRRGEAVFRDMRYGLYCKGPAAPPSPPPPRPAPVASAAPLTADLLRLLTVAELQAAGKAAGLSAGAGAIPGFWTLSKEPLVAALAARRLLPAALPPSALAKLQQAGLLPRPRAG